jgi:predicted transcriptional regulator
MTVSISPHKVSRILSHFFRGVSQTAIATVCGVDQSTVSLYASRFKILASRIGVLGAGKEFGVFNEVNSLRSLSVELAKAKLTVEEARRGLRMIQLFTDMGIPPERHADLVELCRKIDEPLFIQAALEVAKAEQEMGMNYDGMVRSAGKLAREIHMKNDELKTLQAELASVNRLLTERKAETSAMDRNLAKLRQDAEYEEKELRNKLTKMKMKCKVEEEQLAEFISLKADLVKSGITIAILKELAKEFINDKGKS